MVFNKRELRTGLTLLDHDKAARTSLMNEIKHLKVHRPVVMCHKSVAKDHTDATAFNIPTNNSSVLQDYKTE